MGSVVISRNSDIYTVKEKVFEDDDEVKPLETFEIAENVYAHFFSAIDDAVIPLSEDGTEIRFEWSETTHDDTITDKEFREYEKLLPSSYPVDSDVSEYLDDEDDEWPEDEDDWIDEEDDDEWLDDDLEE